MHAGGQGQQEDRLAGPEVTYSVAQSFMHGMTFCCDTLHFCPLSVLLFRRLFDNISIIPEIIAFKICDSMNPNISCFPVETGNICLYLFTLYLE